MKRYSLIMLGLCLFVMACTKGYRTPASDCTQVSHTWSHDVVPLLTNYCTSSSFGGCHQAGSQYGDWTDYSKFKDMVDGGHVKEHCLDSDEIPPAYSAGPHPLKAIDKQLLRCWIADGAQKN